MHVASMKKGRTDHFSNVPGGKSVMPLFDIHTPALLIKIRNITAPAALVMVRVIPETQAYSGYSCVLGSGTSKALGYL